MYEKKKKINTINLITLFAHKKKCEKWKLVVQSCPALCDHMDYSLHGSSVHGILQARILEWGGGPKMAEE